MTDVTQADGAADTGVPYDTGGLPKVLDPKSFPQREETHNEVGDVRRRVSRKHGDFDEERRSAARELNEQRGADAKRIKVRELDDDARPLTGARDAAERIAGTRRVEAAARLADASGARSNSAAEFVGLSVYDAVKNDGPVIRQYADPDARPKNEREAARHLVEARTVTDPADAQQRDQQFQEIVSLLNGDEVLARQALGEQQMPTEQPAEVAQPEPQKIDPFEQHRQQAAAWVQATAQLHNMTQSELVAKSANRAGARDPPTGICRRSQLRGRRASPC